MIISCRLSSKSGADMIISCGDQRLVIEKCRTLAVWALRLGGVVFQRLHLNSYPGRLVFSLLPRWGGVSKRCPRILDGVVFQKLGWCSKKLSQNPRWGGVPKVWMVFQKVVPEWGGVPKSCPRIPTARWGGVPKVVPESPLCILLDLFETLHICGGHIKDVHVGFIVRINFDRITVFRT